ncbi:MAG: SDR family NAD(P)-dependent oxidoreductase, partial [Polyangiaceae bacterium]
MNGKTCLVTGATQGIGKETARELVKLGANVTIVGRDPARTEEAATELEKERSGAHVDFLLADLSSMAAVRKLAKDFRAKQDRLDVLVNNAGVVLMEHKTTADGFEATFATNHL